MLIPKQINEGFSIYSLCEYALTVSFGETISDHASYRINRLRKLLEQQPFTGFRSAVPAYTSLSAFFDPIEVHQSTLIGHSCFEKVSNYITDLESTPHKGTEQNNREITIPVCYEGDFGPDLNEVAAVHHMDVQEVIHLHTEAIYNVHMIGFVPGFAYLGGLPKALATPRKKSPRVQIPSGSIGIAGVQTGIYSLDTPGGWQIIGRTPLVMFDAQRKAPSLLSSGDRVTFERISAEEFEFHAKRSKP
ncbi:5-oxoprolinase subunit PxpB [Olivibacter sp. SDN3]|uniref:5-oxoprolinase subunit PxpB n=1 Tax=Olivibacter sp. SDN3 TaxID=2764720 RepID=UPI00165147F2|nr:5-oxoprolinase subunit PxpB [Olivibacter sp. SDN3]QNL49412.1 5-oxoprolinase subunit PxpB [Olivibacter sp. SDN3]